ncbi:MAG: hypothetical protein WC527_06195 [Candidatus Margulisiibacteriota bacterium]
MVSPVTGSLFPNVVATAAQKDAPPAPGVRPNPIATRNCKDNGYAYIQSISNEFGYREAGMLSKNDLKAPVSALTYPPKPGNSLKALDAKEIAQRAALVAKLTDETWVQLIEKGYIDVNGIIQDKFKNTSAEDLVLSFSGGEKTRIPEATQEIHDVLKKSNEGKVESHISSSYIMEREKAGFGRLPYTGVLLLLGSLQALGYVPSSKPGAVEKDTREKLIEGIAEFQDKHTDIRVKTEDKGNRVGPATITILVQELKTLK